MFYYLEGVISLIGAGFAVMDCGGIGFHVYTTANSLAALQLGQKAKLYTHSVIREDCFDLYGFATAEEKRSFELLLSVSGVGPKAAQAILSCNTPETLTLAILGGNEKAITAAPGIGKKIAQRVLLELKDKIRALSGDSFLPPASSASSASAGQGRKLSEVTAALTVLGYSGNEIAAALQGIEMNTLEVQDVIRLALKNMVK